MIHQLPEDVAWFFHQLINNNLFARHLQFPLTLLLYYILQSFETSEATTAKKISLPFNQTLYLSKVFGLSAEFNLFSHLLLPRLFAHSHQLSLCLQ